MYVALPSETAHAVDSVSLLFSTSPQAAWRSSDGVFGEFARKCTDTSDVNDRAMPISSDPHSPAQSFALLHRPRIIDPWVFRQFIHFLRRPIQITIITPPVMPHLAFHSTRTCEARTTIFRSPRSCYWIVIHNLLYQVSQ